MWHKETKEEKQLRKSGFITKRTLSTKVPLRKYKDRKIERMQYNG